MEQIYAAWNVKLHVKLPISRGDSENLHWNIAQQNIISSEKILGFFATLYRKTG